MDSKHYNQMNWEEIESVVYADCDKPCNILGVHKKGKSNLIQVFFPDALKVTANFKISGKNKTLKLEKVDEAGFFAQFFNYEYDSYTLTVEYENLIKEKVFDPYSFNLELDSAKLREVIRGRSHTAYEVFGSHKKTVDDVEGYEFVLYAPSASSVSLVGDFNNWNEKANLMEKDSSVRGVYKLFLPGICENAAYKYAINCKGSVYYKNDPFALEMDKDNSLVVDFKLSSSKSKKKEIKENPEMLEVDLVKLYKNYHSAEKMCEYIADHCKKYVYNSVSFIHLFKTASIDGIYDVMNAFSVISYEGYNIKLLKKVTKLLKDKGLNTYIELPLAFCSDASSGLMLFDGSRLFENEDSRLNSHKYYNAMLYDYTHPFTKSYLLSSVNFFLNEFDFAGYIFPNAGVIIYHDYNKNPGEYINEEWGNTLNSKGVSFIKDVNRFVHKEYKNALCIASIYAYYKNVTGKTADSLCFDYCMNTGACNEILDFLRLDSTFRREHLDSFLMVTHFNNNEEKYIYPYSRVENVKNNASIYDKMPGDKYQKLSNLKMSVIFRHLLNGAQLSNLDIDVLEGADDDIRKDYLKFYADFRLVYENNKHRIRNYDTSRPFSYKCIDNQVITREYFDGEKDYIIVFNFSKDAYPKYTIPVTHEGVYREVFNSDNTEYGGKGVINTKQLMTTENEDEASNNLTIKLPSLSILAFEYREFTAKELRDIFLKKKKAMIKYVEGEKKKVRDKLNADIDVLKKEADDKIKDLEKLLEPYNEK